MNTTNPRNDNSNQKGEELETTKGSSSSKTNFRERFIDFFQEYLNRLKTGFKKRFIKFIIVSLIGLGVNLLAVFLTELLIDNYIPILAVNLYEFFIWTFKIRDLIAIAMGIASATTSNYLLNKFWTFQEAQAEKTITQFLKYAIVGGSGAVLKYVLTFAFNTGFLQITSERAAVILSSAIAFTITVVWNYIWNEVWTFTVEEKSKEEIIIPENLTYEKFTVITPTFNENENIGMLMETLDKLYPDIHLIVADDGSTDGTREQVREYNETNPSFQLLDREKEPVHGLTISVLEAIKRTITPYYIVMDCDLQHPPEKVGEIAVKLLEDYHYVVGEREEIPDWPFSRRLISWGASVIGKFSLWIHRSAKCDDVMSGFFGGKTTFTEKIIEEHPDGFRPKGYKVLFELLKHSPRKETKVGRVGYIFQPREKGESKISSKHIFEFLRSAFP
ncbi:MAG: GtrA family protein [Asgard group archaeon]|nr:GtrA family protein [Asgard group archaeon]